jgi:hypothetical protein
MTLKDFSKNHKPPEDSWADSGGTGMREHNEGNAEGASNIVVATPAG